jgi:hypothetical protein
MCKDMYRREGGSVSDERVASKSKWVINEDEPFQGGSAKVRTFTVWKSDDPQKKFGVWFNEASRRASCCHCQSALRGMSASCSHARLVKKKCVAGEEGTK